MKVITSNFHTHTDFCDGKDRPETIVLQAIEGGMTDLGFSGHAYTPCDLSYAMTRETAEKYRQEIRRLQSEYSHRINILCGLEMDYFSEQDTSQFDYTIGSVHYVFCKNGEYCPVDEAPEITEKAIERAYGGDPYGLVEDYFRQEGDVVRKTGCAFIGHFDLLTKFQERKKLFDESHPRYIAAWQSALDQLIPYGVPFEINTGAISRGYRTSPYPSMDILKEIARRGGKIVFSSDSHEKDTLRYGFAEAVRLAREAGFSTHWVLEKNGMREEPLENLYVI